MDKKHIYRMEIIDFIRKKEKRINLNDPKDIYHCGELLDDFLRDKIYVDYSDDLIDVIIDNLNLILAYTNCDSLWYIDLLDDDKFREVFLKYILDNLQKYVEDRDFEIMLSKLCKYGCEEFVLSDVFLDKLFKCNKSRFLYRQLYFCISDKNIEKYLNKCLENLTDLDSTFLQIINYYKRDYFLDNIDKIIANTKEIFYVKRLTKNEVEIQNKIRSYIENNEEKVLDDLAESYMRRKFSKNFNDVEAVKGIIKLLVKDIIKNENTNLSSVSEIGEGSYCSVLLIGEKVLKMGYERQTKSFKNNPYIVAPLIRKSFSLGSRELFVEVTEEVDANTPVSEEEIYQLYKKVRNLSLVWNDCTKVNVGYLKKDNVRHWRFDLEPSDEVLNLEPGEVDIVLKAGDLVILDSDFIYDEDDENILDPQTSSAAEFENRFQEELNNLLENIIDNNIEIYSDEYNELIESNGFRVQYITKKLKQKISTIHI